MKSDEPSSPNGNISPINGSISNLADDGKASSSKTARKGEPLLEKLPNFSRVTPAQLAHITFPADGRYQPVRAVSTKSPPGAKNNSKTATVAPAGSKSATAALGLSEKYAGGGGILILVDEFPDEEAEFVEFEAPAAEPVPAEGLPNGSVPNGHATTGPASGPHIALDEDAPEADPPESFEVR
jgi:26S proteasome regulatory subunit N2